MPQGCYLRQSNIVKRLTCHIPKLWMVTALLWCTGHCSFAQTAKKAYGGIFVDLTYYRETQRPFSFKDEDPADFQLPKGTFVDASFTYYVSDKVTASLKTGFGVFKPHGYVDHGVPKSYSASMIPILVHGELRLLKIKHLSWGITAGTGVHIVNWTVADHTTNTDNSEQKTYFTYTYGITMNYPIFATDGFTFLYGLSTFDNRQFMTFVFRTPIFVFKRKQH